MTFIKPCLSLELVQCLKNGLCTYTMRAMRVCEVTGKINLMRLHLLKKLYDDIDVSLSTFPFLYSASLIERQIEEMCIGLIVQTE